MGALAQAAPLWDEIVPLRNLVLSAKKIVTHKRPDLDACLSLWICQRLRALEGMDTLVSFIASDAVGVPKGVVAVDMGLPAGIRSFGDGFSIKGSAHGGSACLALWRCLPSDEQNIFRILAQQISYADTSKQSYVDRLKVTNQVSPTTETLNTIRCLSIFDMHSSLLASGASEFDLFRLYTLYFDGVLKRGKDRLAALPAIHESEYYFYGQFAVVPHDAPLPATRKVFKTGVQALVFSRKLNPVREGVFHWTLVLTKRRDSFIDFRDLFLDRLEEKFPTAHVSPEGNNVGWSSRDSLTMTEKEFFELRNDFIEYVMGIVEPWFLSTGH